MSVRASETIEQRNAKLEADMKYYEKNLCVYL